MNPRINNSRRPDAQRRSITREPFVASPSLGDALFSPPLACAESAAPAAAGFEIARP